MKRIVWFSEITKDDIAIAGGKGANLGEMFSLNLPVPDGFVTSAKTYGEYLEDTGLNTKIAEKLKELSVEDTEELQRVAKEIQEMIQSTKMSEAISSEIIDAYELLCAKDAGGADALVDPQDVFVAVRSSATAEDLPNASFAGQQASFLNVKGKNNVVKAVLDCWASLFTARAIYYRTKQGFDHNKVLIAAVIQKMVNSEKSGIMFTVNPATNVEEEIVIEAVFGLGEAIVSGSVTPDLYIVDKKSRRLLQHEIKIQEWGYFRDPETGDNFKKQLPEEIGSSQTMSDRDVEELSRLGKKIEEHYGNPQDIEWAMEKGKLYIVQSRAVTTFKPKKKEGPVSEGDTTTVEAELSPLKKHGKELLQGDVACQGIVSGPVRLVKDMHDLKKVVKGDILVTVMTTPDMVPAMEITKGIVTDEGGLTCHAAIVSREMGVPCVVGTEKATSILQDGDIITIDAVLGKIYSGDLHSDLSEKHSEVLSPGSKESSQKISVTKTHVKVILGMASRAETAAATGCEGVGLLRLEFIIAQGGVHPAEHVRKGTVDKYVALLVDNIGQVAKAFGEKPVWVRSSDLRSDEYRGLVGGDKEPHESDPMLGWHGIRRLLDEEAILRAEFKAVKELHSNGVRNVGIMIPFVIRAEEVARAKEIFEEETGLLACTDVPFGVMIETPAACGVIEEICAEGISFVSFGTNDLTQLTLGIDRNNEHISSLFDEMHPAVLYQIADVIGVCREHGVETSICGQAGSRPEMAQFLVEHGIDSVSVDIDAVAKISSVIAKAEEKVSSKKKD